MALDEVGAAEAGAERPPELRLERAERDPAVGARVRPVAGEPAGQLQLAAARHGAPSAKKRAATIASQLCAPRVIAHVDELALARAVALVQRGEDPERRHQRAAAEVGDLAGGRHRRRRRARRSSPSSPPRAR